MNKKKLKQKNFKNESGRIYKIQFRNLIKFGRKIFKIKYKNCQM